MLSSNVSAGQGKRSQVLTRSAVLRESHVSSCYQGCDMIFVDSVQSMAFPSDCRTGLRSCFLRSSGNPFICRMRSCRRRFRMKQTASLARETQCLVAGCWSCCFWFAGDVSNSCRYLQKRDDHGEKVNQRQALSR